MTDTETPTPPAPADNSDEPEDNVVKLRPNGAVLMIVAGTQHLLRVPNMGELRAYREAIADVLESAKAAAIEAETQQQVLAEQVAAGDATLGVAKLDAMLGEFRESASAEATQAGLVALGRMIVADLDRRGRRLPEQDGVLPPWLGNLQLYTQLIEHWRTVPLAPGR